MKKLLTFAGVSALALITAAPNAFGAYGIYNPSCGANAVTVNFWGYNEDGEFDKLETLTFQSGAWKKGSNQATTLSASVIKEVSNVKVGSNTYKKLIPMQFQSVGGEPESAPVNTSTTCPADTTKGRYAIGGTLPSTISGLENRKAWNYVIAYAVDCEVGSHATCELEVNRNTGKATYTNACASGYSNPNWSQTTALMCEELEYIPSDNPATDVSQES